MTVMENSIIKILFRRNLRGIGKILEEIMFKIARKLSKIILEEYSMNCLNKNHF
jgi:hypothetical protein